jgi:hypothetical protein
MTISDDCQKIGRNIVPIKNAIALTGKWQKHYSKVNLKINRIMNTTQKYNEREDYIPFHTQLEQERAESREIKTLLVCALTILAIIVAVEWSSNNVEVIANWFVK